MSPRIRITAALAVLALITPLAATLPASAATNLITNPGFETGALSGWSCSAGTGAVVADDAHTGSSSLRGTPAAGDNARCAQTVSVQPGSAYTLSAWVKGTDVYLGIDGGVSTWSTNSAWNQLTTTFTATGGSVTVYLHGWYGQPAYHADDIVLEGPGGTGPPPDTTVPSVPANLAAGQPTSSSLWLTWSAASDNVGVDHYDVSRDGGAATGLGNVTAYTATGLAPATTYTFRVRACDAAGNCSAYGNQASGTTSQGTTPPAGPLPAHIVTGYWQNFDNGATVQRIRDVQGAYDLIAVAFADAVPSTPGAIDFTLDPALSSRLGGYTEADLKADVAAKRAAGKKVIVSVGGQNGTVVVNNATAATNFANSVSSWRWLRRTS